MANVKQFTIEWTGPWRIFPDDPELTKMIGPLAMDPIYDVSLVTQVIRRVQWTPTYISPEYRYTLSGMEALSYVWFECLEALLRKAELNILRWDVVDIDNT